MTAGEAPPANPFAAVAKGAAGTLVGFVPAYVLGSVICAVMDAWMDLGKPAYAYVVWFLLPAIAIFLALSAAGEWAAKPPPGKPSWIYRADAVWVGAWLVLGGLIATGLLYWLCTRLGWSYRDDDFWVPGSRPHTIAFFVGGVIGMACSWWMAKLEQKPAKD